MIDHNTIDVESNYDDTDDSEDDIHDNLPPFSIGIPSMNVDINDAAYLRSDHNEGSYVEER